MLPHARSNMRRAAIGFKGLALAPVTENSMTSYAASAGEALPYAGSMSRTAKESTTDLYYDDDLYAQIKNVSGEDVEIRVAEVPLERMAAGFFQKSRFCQERRRKIRSCGHIFGAS